MDDVLSYTKRGYYVLPLKGKIPISARGVYDATINENVIRSTFVNGRNVGIATGALSGITVVDIDGPNGVASMKKLVEEHGRLFTLTPTVKTPKGFHLYYKYNDSVTNRVRVYDGIDIRNNGGYVVAPPSRNGDGIHYKWVRDFKFPVQNFPVWLSVKREAGRTNWCQTEWVSEGSRNETLASVCGALLSSRIDTTLAYTLLNSYNEARVNPPLESEEVDKVFRSILSIENRKR